MADLDVKVVVQAVKDRLISAGFKCSRMLCRKETEDCLLLIKLQKSVDSRKDRLIVTANIGVYSLVLGDKIGNRSDDFQDQSFWHWSSRIGRLMPVHQDKWWTATNADDLQIVAQEIAEAIVEFALPALENLDSTEKLVHLWKKDISPGLTEVQRTKLLSLLDS